MTDPSPPSPSKPSSAPIGSEAVGRATELPVVVLGEESGRVKPQIRLLPGRVYISFVLYPIYVLILGAGVLAVNFALQTGEWSAPVVALAYGLLFCWHWVYSVAYRYRRWLLKFFALFASLFMGASMTYLVWERAQAQHVAIDGRLVMRPEVGLLEPVWLATATSVGLLLIHVLILGRGYREKRYRAKPREQNEGLNEAS